MKTIQNRVGQYGLYCLSGILGVMLCAVSVRAAEGEWPMEFQDPAGTVVVYQPQVETFKKNIIEARAAVSVTQPGSSEPVFGAIWVEARVSTDRDTRIVNLLDIKVSNVRFPNSTKEQQDNLAAFLEKEVPKRDITFKLDSLLAMLDVAEKEQQATLNIDTTPPQILFANTPAVLVTLTGDPIMNAVPDTKLMRIVNTPFFIVLDMNTKKYYLKGGTIWYSAGEALGPWQYIENVPEEVRALAEKDQDTSAEQEESFEQIPEIIVSTKPAELIVINGPPDFAPIRGTSLLYIKNTDSDVFLDINTQSKYVLLAGRWYSAESKDGPWVYVAPDKLPSDFTEISSESDKGDVLAQVAGTVEAKDAVLDTYIPQTAAIKRDEATISVTYDGDPQFEPVEGTEMEYAVNTGYSVVRADNRYYCCNDGVWFESEGPIGLWKVSVRIPPVIYTMPPSCPVYPVRYVYVYDYTPEVVYVGYTPGYIGCYPYAGVVVYGTGYHYRPWYRNYYYSRPVTFGYGVHYSSYSGWGFRVGWGGPVGWVGFGYSGMGWGVAGGYGGWNSGGWWGYGGYRECGNQVYIDNRTVYKKEVNVYNRRPNWDESQKRKVKEQYDGRQPRDNREREIAQGDQRRDRVETTDQQRRQETRETITDRRQAGDASRREVTQRDQATGRIQPTDSERREQIQDRAGREVSQRDQARERIEPTIPDRTGQRQPTTGGTTRPATQPTTRPATRPNNVYTDKSGNVYKQDIDGWQKRESTGWSKPAQQPAQRTPSQTQVDLNRQQQARQSGTSRAQSYQRTQTPAQSRTTAPSVSRPSSAGAARPAGGGATRPIGGEAVRPTGGGAARPTGGRR